MSKYKIIAAVQAKEFGAAVFDTLTKRLFVVDPGEGYSTESPLQSLFKQINAEVVLYPGEETGNHTTKLALSELCYLEDAEKIDLAGVSINPLTLKCFMKVTSDTLSYLQVFNTRKHPNMHSQSKYREATSLFKMILADLESLAQFSYAIVKLHRFLATIHPVPSLIQEPSVFVELGCLIVDTVDFESSRRGEQVVVAKNVSSTVDQLRNQFNALDQFLATASSDMEELAGVPVVAVYFPQLGFLSSVDMALFNGESDSIPQTENWKLEAILDDSPGDVFTLLNDAEAEFNECGCYHVHEGRHPIVEASLDQRQFISNDIDLASRDCLHMEQQTRSLHRMLVILGPNASGKSVLIKQMALITYMAHIGSFVPARAANINLTDRIVAVGRATESLVKQQSAFSSDLQIVLDILKQAGPKTLVLLDEFGRGTSPADGMGLLSGVLAVLNNKPACLAVTHFQEIVRVKAIQEIWKHASVKAMSFTENATGLVYLFRSGDTTLEFLTNYYSVLKR
ncbi:hypothetical protein EV183_001146 [Coemansia sp. RSA 2336]|nr:hypothetical protein EV183_001146 [Coemansia sp. RSA 2336]